MYTYLGRNLSLLLGPSLPAMPETLPLPLRLPLACESRLPQLTRLTARLPSHTESSGAPPRPASAGRGGGRGTAACT